MRKFDKYDFEKLILVFHLSSSDTFIGRGKGKFKLRNIEQLTL